MLLIQTTKWTSLKAQIRVSNCKNFTVEMYLVDTHVVFKRVRRDPALFLSSKVKDKVCNKGGEMAPGCNPLCATRVEVESSPEITDSGGGTCDGPARLQLWELLLRSSNSTANFYSINVKEAILGRATIRANRLCRCFTSSWEHKITCEPQALTGSAYYAATTLTNRDILTRMNAALDVLTREGYPVI